jgi:hypothetical protein
MLSRALILATAMLLIGGFAADPALAQATNLEAGKSPSQIFAGTCNACHKSPRGLLKTVSAGSLPGFLRQHYTTSSEMAGLLSAFLVSNGAADTRYVGSQPKPGKDAKSDAKPAGPVEQLDRFGRRQRPSAPSQEEAAKPEAQPQQAAKPDADGISPQAETGHQGRNAKRRPGEAPDTAKPGAEGQPPAQEASERGPDGRKLSAKQRLSKRGKPGSEQPPKTDAAKDEPATGEPVKDDKSKSEPKSETAKDEGNKPEGTKPSGEAKSETAKETGKETGKETAKTEAPRDDAPKATGSGETKALRPDPVPAVTPAPKSAEGETRPVQTATPAPVSSPAASGPAPAATAEAAAPPAVTASAPPPAPPVPAGPPAPPISQ